MGKWVRVKDDQGIEKVSLVVRRDVEPDVYEWLQNIPYGKVNARIKEALRFFIQSGQAGAIDGGMGHQKATRDTAVTATAMASSPSVATPPALTRAPDPAPAFPDQQNLNAVSAGPYPASVEQTPHVPTTNPVAPSIPFTEHVRDQTGLQLLEGVDPETLAVMQEMNGRF